MFGKKKRRYSKPKNPYDKVRFEEEAELVKRYGLKNKKEIWKAESAIDRIRKQAKKLITADPLEAQKLIDKLKKQGFKVEKISDILGLDKEDLLKRRLQSVVVEKKLGRTPKHARQLITHKHISVSGNIVNVPSYIVSINDEDKITIGGKFKKIEEVGKKKVEEEIKKNA